MDRLVVADVKEVEIPFKRNQRCSTTFRLTNLMHTMHVAICLTTSNPSLFSFSSQTSFSILPPLSTASFSLLLSQPSDQPPLSSPLDSITVRSSMLPIRKANQDDLRRLFSKPGPHIFRDATISISFVGPHVVEFLLSSSSPSINPKPGINSPLSKAISGCTNTQLNSLLKQAVMESGNENYVKALIDAGGEVNFREADHGPSILSLAIRSGNIEIVKILIASGCNLDNSVDLVLHDAAAKDEAVGLMEVLCAGFEDVIDVVNLVDSNGRSALHVAAIRGNVEALRFLVSIGGNPDAADSNGWTPLHFAASEGRLEAIEFLLDSCPFAKYAINKKGESAFTIAVENGHSQLYDLLHLGDALNRAARLDDVNGLKSSIAEGAKVNGKDQNGWTPLHRAAFKGRMESVKILISNGAQVDVVDDAGFTPLHCAVEAGHVKVALFLISHGANANVKSREGLVPFDFDDCFKMKNNQPSSLVHPLCRETERAA